MGAVVGIYIFIWFGYAIYYWATKTDKSMAPLERRLKSFACGLVWPVFLISAFMNRDQRAADKSSLDESKKNILG